MVDGRLASDWDACVPAAADIAARDATAPVSKTVAPCAHPYTLPPRRPEAPTPPPAET